MSRADWAEIVEQLKCANSIIVLSHQNPDSDALGSSCGLTLALQLLGKNAVCVNENTVTPESNFIAGFCPVFDNIPEGCWDLVVVCDCGDKKRIGERILSQLSNDIPLVNIDHHYSNNEYGSYNLVVPSASSASEVVYGVVSDLLGTLSQEIANCLLAGIIADTGGFRYSCTSATTFLVAEKLVKAGADLARINVELFSNKPFSAVRLSAAAVNNMQVYADGKVVELLITPEMMISCGAESNDCNGLVDLGRDISGVLVSSLIRYVDGIWKVSLRSKFPEQNVSKIAEHFGGGGHVQAAAFRYSGQLEDFREKLVELMCQIVK